MDTKFMREALLQARKGLGRTSPNPAVGAVIVKNGKILARGYHHMAGQPHAEVDALRKVGGRAEKSTLYVTLEPCNHHGKTPPCTEAILSSGIKKVVIGTRDPNPGVSGGGCEFLKMKGIEVVTGVLEEECTRLIEAYLKFVISNRPFVALKSAMTIDGWTATATGHSKWITNNKSRQFVHRLRDRFDAVLVGIGTVLADNPRLTTRLTRGRGRDPLRVVVDTHLRTPPGAKILSQDSTAPTMIAVGPDIDPANLKNFEKEGVFTGVCNIKGGRIDLADLLDILGRMKMTSILVEGGASIAGSMLRGGFVDKCYFFMAPKILAGGDGVPVAQGMGALRIDECIKLKDLRIRRFEDDILVEGYTVYGK